jgi:hypothetical protein
VRAVRNLSAGCAAGLGEIAKRACGIGRQGGGIVGKDHADVKEAFAQSSGKDESIAAIVAGASEYEYWLAPIAGKFACQIGCGQSGSFHQRLVGMLRFYLAQGSAEEKLGQVHGIPLVQLGSVSLARRCCCHAMTASPD